MRTARRRLDVNLDELDRVLDGARQAPLSEDDYEKLKERIACAGGDAGAAAQHGEDQRRAGKIGRLGNWRRDCSRRPTLHQRPDMDAMVQRRSSVHGRLRLRTQKLKHGDRCPECGKGNVYGQKEPKVLVRIVGQAPLAATVYSLERLRCGACGQVLPRKNRKEWVRKSTTRPRRR